MKLAETYANYCGVNVGGRNVFPDLFCPTPERYVTFHNSSGMQSKNYDFYNEVILMLRPEFSKAGIEIVQIGGKEDHPLHYAIRNNGHTTLRQSAYTVKRALLHVGNDSLWAHYAAYCDVPLVALYGPTLAAVCGPCHPSSKQVLLESDRGGGRATHSPTEGKKTINMIKPEKVAAAALDLLGFKSSIGIETVYIGQQYNSVLVELVPDHVMPPIKNLGLINIRMDYHFNEQLLAHNLSVHPKASIFTDRPVDINLLKFYAGKIEGMYYMLRPENESVPTDVAWVDAMHRAPLPYTLITECRDESLLSKMRMDFFDHKPIAKSNTPDRKNLDIPEAAEYSNAFKTNRTLIANGKMYPSKSHWEKGDSPKKDWFGAYPLEEEYLSDPSFWENGAYFYLLKKC